MFKRLLFLALVAGILAGVASLVYNKVYTSSFEADFSKIATTASIIGASVLGCVVASIGYWLLHKWLKGNTDIVFNLVFVILSFASILKPIAVKLPLEIENPELFPGLVVPMHFFPVLAWLTLRPLFLKYDSAWKA